MGNGLKAFPRCLPQRSSRHLAVPGGSVMLTGAGHFTVTYVQAAALLRTYDREVWVLRTHLVLDYFNPNLPKYCPEHKLSGVVWD